MFSGEYGAPDSMGQVLLLPLLFTFFAVAGRIAARKYWRNFGKRKAHWWYVYPLLALALYFGFKWMYLLFNPDNFFREAYRQTLIERRILVSHWLAFLIPLISTIWIALYDRLESSRIKRQSLGA